ncbi:PKD domain-containing protein, partial [bacterium]|nr:PKD domain-containing protein [bacterium]
GDYRVTLQVTDEKGIKNSVSKTINPVPKIKPIVLFQMKKKQYIRGENIYFDNSSFSKGGELKSNRWDFGDGTESSLRNPSHRYKSTGDYTVKLKVCDSDGLCDTASEIIRVAKIPVTNAVKGEDIHAYIAKNGQPAESLIKKNASINAYRYGNIWLLAKWDRIDCAVLDGGLSMTLMGYPKQCHWHEKYAANYMIDLK